MNEIQSIDQTLDRLEHAVADLTSTTNIDALRYIHKLARTPGCSRHAAESARHIAELCSHAESDLMESIGHMEAERDDDAHDRLDHALSHLDAIAETVDSISHETRPTPEARSQAQRS